MIHNTVPPVTVVVPVFGAADQLRRCLLSLVQHIPQVSEICIADDCTPDDSIVALAREFQDRLPNLRWERREQNVGFVTNCNLAAQPAIDRGDDVLLLNSDTEVTAGFLEEMQVVLYAHEKHAAVSPRSNNATIFSVPIFERLDAVESFELWKELKRDLPRFHVVPTCCGFCMLVRNSVLQTFGLFDTDYSPGYNEENDFVCRINRFGYSAVAANHAFVFHFESASFGTRRKFLEKRNREILDKRYPEYGRKVTQYIHNYLDPVEHVAPTLRRKRKFILYDLYHLPAKHCGTSEFALNLLSPLAPLLEEKFDIYLGLNKEAEEFFGPDLVGYRKYNEERASPRIFDLVFKPSQVFRWPEWYRMIRLGARLAYTHQDSIAIRCDYLCGPNTRQLFKLTAELSDLTFCISESAKQDFERLYNINSRFVVIHHGTSITEATENPGDYVLLVGNGFAHKALGLAEQALAGVAPTVVLGASDGSPAVAEVRRIPSGQLTRSHVSHLYDCARVVVFPSFYEGFGLPVIDALSLGKHVVALDHDVNRELRDLCHSDRLHLVADFSEMRPKVASLMKAASPKAATPRLRTWHDAARDYVETIGSLLDSPVNTNLLRRRWDLMQTLESYHPFN